MVRPFEPGFRRFRNSITGGGAAVRAQRRGRGSESGGGAGGGGEGWATVAARRREDLARTAALTRAVLGTCVVPSDSTKGCPRNAAGTLGARPARTW